MNLLAIVAGWILAKMFARLGPDDPLPAPEPPPPGFDPRSRAPSPAARRTPPRPQPRSRRPIGPGPSPAPVRPTQPASFSPPWPQVVPSGLPGFPGPGWTPDNPPPPAVSSRAAQLLSPLWSGGEGTFKVEKTAGRWIVYRATAMGTKKGVVAFREAQDRAPIPSDAFGPLIDEPTEPASSPTVRASARSPSGLALPTLRKGSSGNDVALLQQRLGLSPADGAFGPMTDAAVRRFQGAHGLATDGVVGPQTWGALLGQSA